MKEYEIKRGHFKNIEGEKLKELMMDTFGSVKSEEDKLVINFGALQPLKTWIKDKNVLCVDTQMDKNVDDDTINGTISSYNKFLEAATGFTAKERLKRAKKKIKG
ncbi:MAG: DUF5611 family protein [Thermoplasmata archaeon]|nr:DUF5611 family protein [Thermoplasmata archaeon]